MKNIRFLLGCLLFISLGCYDSSRKQIIPQITTFDGIKSDTYIYKPIQITGYLDNRFECWRIVEHLRFLNTFDIDQSIGIDRGISNALEIELKKKNLFEIISWLRKTDQKTLGLAFPECTIPNSKNFHRKKVVICGLYYTEKIDDHFPRRICPVSISLAEE